MSCRDVEENLPQTSRNRVHPLQGKPWLGAVDYRCYLAEQTTALQVSLPSNCIAFWGLCSSVRLFVFLYTHKKTVDFIYFCIVLHFIFMGRFYGLFFYLRTLCFKMVWFTVPMEKKSNLLLSLLLPLPVQCKKTTSLLTPLCTTLLNVIRGPGSANQQPGPCQYLLSLCGRR